jgi:aryl-alcohol dehydrogenase-like predicted oxidoreductase
MAIAVRSLTLGCAQFGKGYGFYVNTPELTSDEIGQILEVAFGEGVETLDLAQGYEGVTTNLSAIGRVNRFKLGTKVKYSDTSDDKLIRALASDLKILNASHFESILIHDWSDLTSSQKASGLNFLTELKNQGVTKSIGISVYERSELIEINEPIEIVQAPLSYFNTEFLFDENSINLARNGVSFHARSIFHQGTLLNTKTLPPRFHAETKKYEEYCKDHGLTFLQGALAVFDSQDVFRNLVVGVSNAIQLHEITQSPVKVIDSMLDTVPAGLPKDLTDPRQWTNT